MEKLEIRPLLERNLAKNDLSLLQVLEREIKGFFAAFGKHHTMAPGDIATDCKFMAKRLNEAIKVDRRYSSLRTAEIPYLFRQGAQGALGDKYKQMSLMMLYSWLAEYMNSGERRAAMSEWVSENSRDMPDVDGNAVGRVMTDSDMWRWVENSYNTYCEQLALKTRPLVPVMLQKDKVPWAGKDLGGQQKMFLVRHGYMKPEEKFHEFLDRAIENEGVFLKVV